MSQFTAKINRIILTTLFGLVALVVFIFNLNIFSPAQAATGIPNVINYQGKLNDSNGNQVTDGTYNAKFVIYDAASGGNCLWTAIGACDTSDYGTTTVTVTNGIFSVQLGNSSQNSIATSTIDFNTDALYLGVTIRGTAASPVYDSEMSPRKQLTSSPYAFNAGQVDGINATSTAAVANYLLALDGNGNLDLYTGGVSSTRATTSEFLLVGNDGGLTNLDRSGGDLFVGDSLQFGSELFGPLARLSVLNATTTNIGALTVYDNATFSGNLTVSGYVTSTVAFYTQGILHVGGTTELEGLVSGTGFDSSVNTLVDSRITDQWRALPNGLASLNASGKVPNSQLSPLAISNTFVVSSEAEMLALSSAETGDVAIRTDINTSYILNGTYSVLTNWHELLTPTEGVISVNGVSGVVVLSTDDVSEGSANKYYTDDRVDSRITGQWRGFANGLASLDASGKVPTSQIGSLPITNTYVVASEAAMLALTSADTGDVAVRSDENKTYVLQGTDPTSLGDWVELLNSASVTSVNAKTGAVTLTTSDITEGSNWYWTNQRFDDRLNATSTWATTLQINGGALGVGIAPSYPLEVIGNASTSDKLYIGHDLYVGHASSGDSDSIYFDQGAETFLWSNPSDRFELSNGLYVSGNATTTGSLHIGNTSLRLEDGSIYQSTGNLILSTAAGLINVDDDLTVSGYASSTAGLFTQGAGHFGSNLTVDGNATTTGNLRAGGLFNLNGLTSWWDGSYYRVGAASPTDIINMTAVHLGYNDSDNFELYLGGNIFNSNTKDFHFRTNDSLNRLEYQFNNANTALMAYLDESGNYWTAGNITSAGYASSTAGLFTQGSGHFGTNLKVDGNATTTGKITAGSVNPTTNATIWADAGTNTGAVYGRSASDASYGILGYDGGQDLDFGVYASGYNADFYGPGFSQFGEVGIGGSTPVSNQVLAVGSSNQFVVDSSGNATTTGNVYLGSSSSNFVLLDDGAVDSANSPYSSAVLRFDTQSSTIATGLDQIFTIQGKGAVAESGSAQYPYLSFGGSGYSNSTDFFSVMLSGVGVNLGSGSDDDYIYFDGWSSTGRVGTEYLEWSNGSDIFILSDDLDVTGNLGVGDITPDSKFDVNGDSTFYGGVVISSSDAQTNATDGLLQVCNGACTAANIATTAGELYVEGDIESDANLNVAGTATFGNVVNLTASGSSVYYGYSAALTYTGSHDMSAMDYYSLSDPTTATNIPGYIRGIAGVAQIQNTTGLNDISIIEGNVSSFGFDTVSITGGTYDLVGVRSYDNFASVTGASNATITDIGFKAEISGAIGTTFGNYKYGLNAVVTGDAYANYGAYGSAADAVTNYGLYGTGTGSDLTYGVYGDGRSASGDGTVYGGYFIGQASSISDYGVYGRASGYSNNGTTYGGYFTADSGETNYALYTNTGSVYIGALTGGNGTVYVNGGILTRTNPSSRDYKDSIQPIDLQASRILDLQPKSFIWKDSNSPDFGYIAEEVRNIVPELYLDDGTTKGFDVAKLPFYIIEVLKQQQAQIDNLSVGGATSSVSGNLTVESAISSTDSLVVENAAAFYGTIHVIGEAGFESDVTFSKDVNVSGKLYLSKDQVGTVTVPANATSTEVVFDNPFITVPKIFANLLGDSSNPIFVNWLVADKTVNSFKIIISQAQDIDLNFDWIALGLHTGADKTFNAPPIISSITASDAEVSPGETIRLDATVSDADSDNLTYQWAVLPDLGQLTDSDTNQAYWHLDQADSNTQVTFTLTVSDGSYWVSSTKIISVVVDPADLSNATTTSAILGCTDSTATNYNSEATEDDSSCTYQQ
ncbi:MAG: tail fiber domain-containing protein, partial [Candidatus Buchananbacteria bacterium]|nr:tail fiber domain-containing protein [Candidatus Buchananbacteria bacterium]